MKNAMNVQEKILLSFIIMFASGVIANYVFTFDKRTSFIVALLVFAILELLILLISFENFSRVGTVADSIAHYFKESGKSSDFYTIELVSSLKKVNREIVYDGICINKREDVAPLWLKCLTHFKTSVQMTSYVNPKYWSEQGYSKPIYDISKLKLHMGGTTLSQMFIWETPEEFAKLQKIIQKYRVPRAKLTHLQLDKFRKDKTYKSLEKVLGSRDFAVFDDSYIFIHYLDKQRNTASAMLTKNEKILSAGKQYIDLLEITLANEF